MNEQAIDNNQMNGLDILEYGIQYTFDNIKPLNLVNELMIRDIDYSYLALVQIDECIDYYLIRDISLESCNQLAYYLYVSYGMDSFNHNTVKFISLIDDNNITIDTCYNQMNAYNSQLVYDTSSTY